MSDQTMRNRSVKEEKRKIPLKVRKETKEIVLNSMSNKVRVMPSVLTSGVRPLNPNLTMYIEIQEKRIINRSIRNMVNLDKTLFDM